MSTKIFNETDILNYRPDLRMDHRPSLNPVIDNDSSTLTKTAITFTEKSDCISNFELLSPSSTIVEFENVLKTLEVSKNIMLENLKNTIYGAKYLASKVEKRKQLVEDNSNDIMGTTYLESYIELERIEDEVSNVKKLYSEFTYGNNIDSENAKNIDESFINKLIALENESDAEGINYVSLYYETMISRLLQDYTRGLSENALSFTCNVFDECKSLSSNDNVCNLLKNNFKKKQKILKNDISKDLNSNYNVRVALKNTFLSLQMYEDTFKALDGSEIALNDFDLNDEIRRDILTDLNESFTVLMNTLRYSQLAKGDVGKTLFDKANLRGYFVSDTNK